MMISSISLNFFELCSFDKELLHNTNRRPHLVVLKLKYKGKRQDFAIPFRSNIPNYVPEEQYFSLPPRATTRQYRIHGLHYIKMFPIKREFLEKFYIKNDSNFQIVKKVITKNKKTIINEAQQYLIEYENGVIPKFATDIERIYCTINTTEDYNEAAATKE
ncbi:hypothetical protein [Natronospora cellulosivora (SeqCode)]